MIIPPIVIPNLPCSFKSIRLGRAGDKTPKADFRDLPIVLTAFAVLLSLVEATNRISVELAPASNIRLQQTRGTVEVALMSTRIRLRQ